MKRLSALLLTVALLATITVGCAKDTDKPESGTKDPVVAGFIYVGPVNDGGYTTAHNNGRLEVEKELGNKVKTIFKENVPEEKGEVIKAIKEMVDQGANIIFTTSFGHMEGTLEAAKEFPDVKFAHCSGYKTADNVTNYFGRMYQARYLSGIVAGLKTKTNKIAYVGAMAIPEVIRGINAFTLGVKSVNPDAEVHVRWTNTWYDPAIEKAAAEALLAEGCDVTAQHQDSSATMIAAKEKGATSIGYNVSAVKTVPEAYITAPMWDWSKYYVTAVQQVIDGTWTNTPYWEGMESGIIYLDKLTSLAPETAAEKVADAEEKIKSGELKIFSGEIKDQNGEVKVKEGDELEDQALLSFDWFVEGVVGKIPEKTN